MTPAELDARVAREIFDYDVPEYREGRIAVPPYSTKIEHAWWVVERMRELGCLIEIEDRRRYGHDDYHVELYWVGADAADRHDGFAYARTLPEAICEAALRAVFAPPAEATAAEGSDR